MNNNRVQIARYSYARITLTRELIHKDDRKSCKWCGQPARFYYWIEPDSIGNKDYRIPGQYCGIECMRIYNHMEGVL